MNISHKLLIPMFITTVIFVALMMTGIAGCSTVTSNPAKSTDTPTAAPLLTVVKGTQVNTYTMSSMKALPMTTGWAGQMSSAGTISGPYQYTGVALIEILKAVGGITENNAVRVSAKDGYAMTLSYNQITQGSGFPVLDSNTGKEVTPSNKLIVFLAYEQDGKPIDESLGPLRLGIITSNTQVTDGHWWVKWAQKIEVIAVQKPWNLNLEGVIKENMDQATFESGAAIGCHGVKWTDDQGQVWEGIPFWYLIGRVDDTDTHKGDAYSDAMADKGYEIKITAADGYTVKFTSTEVKRNNNINVAYKLNGNPLPDKQWPLRVVGSGVDKQRMIGAIGSVQLVFPPDTSKTTMVLTVAKEAQTKTYTLADLKGLPAISGYAGQKPKSGAVTTISQYKGITLTDLLFSVGGITAANNVKIIAKDGFSKTLTYKQITESSFITFDNNGNEVNPESKPIFFFAYEKDGLALDESTGPLTSGVMTNKNQFTEGGWWVKQVQRIEIIAAQ